MKKKKLSRILIYLVFIFFAMQILFLNECIAQKTSISTEEVLFAPIETIISASKREQRIQDSPSTISVISEEDIRESGAMSIPDLLKYIPGIDVMEITSSHWEVNARGLNQLRSNKMLVLIDGRSAYLDYFGGIIWDSLPVQLEDIKRIEIIRGPVSALYGANAFSGIVNIITKSPRESEGTNIFAYGGNLGNKRATIIHGGRNGKLGYKFSGHLRNIDSWRNSTITSEKRGIGNVKLDYLINAKSSLSLDAGIEDGSVEQIILTSILKFNGTTNYAKLNYNYLDTKFQFFWNHGNIESPSYVGYGENMYHKYNTFDGELQHTFNVGSKNTVTVEGSYRFNTIESNNIDRKHHQHLIAGMFQDEFKPLEKVTLLFGVRADHHPLVSNNFSPRGSVIFEPANNHTFRLSVGQAFRNPPFTDSYLYVPLEPIPVPLPSPPFPPDLKTEITILGNVALNPERIRTYEFGYQTLLRRRARLKVNLFYNKITDFIGTGDYVYKSFILDPVSGDPVINPLTGMPIPSEITQSFVNLGSADAYGGELETDVLVDSWIRVRANYSYLKMNNHYTLNRYQSPPQNKVNLIGDFVFKNGFTINVLGHYVDMAKWDIDTDNDNIPEKHTTKSYFTFDTRLAYTIPNTNLNLVFSSLNIFNNDHKEYPIGESIGRRFSIRLAYKF